MTRTGYNVHVIAAFQKQAVKSGAKFARALWMNIAVYLLSFAPVDAPADVHVCSMGATTKTGWPNQPSDLACGRKTCWGVHQQLCDTWTITSPTFDVKNQPMSAWYAVIWYFVYEDLGDFRFARLHMFYSISISTLVDSTGCCRENARGPRMNVGVGGCENLTSFVWNCRSRVSVFFEWSIITKRVVDNLWDVRTAWWHWSTSPR